MIGVTRATAAGRPARFRGRGRRRRTRARVGAALVARTVRALRCRGRTREGPAIASPDRPRSRSLIEMLGQRVFGAVDDPEILTSATFDCGLQQTTRASRDERQRLDDDAFAAGSVRSIHQSVAAASLAGSARSTTRKGVVISRPSSGSDETADRVHVPRVILVGVHRAFGGHHVERRDADVAKRFDRPAVVPVRLGEPVGEILRDL